jgi:hypothetical protein
MIFLRSTKIILFIRESSDKHKLSSRYSRSSVTRYNLCLITVEIPAITEEILWDVIPRNSGTSSAVLIYVNDCLSKCCKFRLLHNQFGFNETLILTIVTDEVVGTNISNSESFRIQTSPLKTNSPDCRFFLF